MNPYDDPALFAAYAGMERSRRGLAGAAEWEQLRALLPPLRGARCWTWAAATAGIAALPPGRARPPCWASTGAAG